jgi:iron(III) transport system ATP-binding protein
VSFGARSMLCRKATDVQVGERVSVFMRPESFRLSRRAHSDDAWTGTVEFSIYHGDCWDYHVRLGEEIVKVRVYQEKVGIAHGHAVYLEPDEESAIVMPAREPADDNAADQPVPVAVAAGAPRLTDVVAS